MTDAEDFLTKLRARTDALADSPFWTQIYDQDTAASFTFRESLIVERLIAIRGERGMSQAELAKRMTARGFPMQQSTVAKIEKHDRPLRLSEFFALCTTLGVPDFAVLMGVPIAEDGSGDESARLDLLADQLRSDVERRERLRAQLTSNVETGARLYAEAESTVLWTATKLQQAGVDAAAIIERAMESDG